MPIPGQGQVMATIASGGSLSAAVDLKGRRLVGIVMPDAWTAAALTFQANEILPANLATAAAGVAIGTTKAKIQAANAMAYLIGGLAYTKAATDDLWTLTGAAFTTARGYLLLLDAAGAASVLATADAASVALLAWPSVPSTKAVIGYVTILAGGGTPTFTPGTTDLDAAGLTVVFGDGWPYKELFDDNNSAVSIAAAAAVAGRFIAFRQATLDQFRAVNHLKVRSGTSATPVAQAAARSLVLLTENRD